MQITDGEVLLSMQNAQDRRYATKQINLANAEIRRLRSVVDDLKHTLAVERAHAAATAGMVREIRMQNPDLQCFKPTGWKMPDGRDQLQIHHTYDEVFDAKAVELDIDGPTSYREVATDPVAEAAEEQRRRDEEEAAERAASEAEAAQQSFKKLLAGRREKHRSGQAFAVGDAAALSEFQEAPGYSKFVWETSGHLFSIGEKLAYKISGQLPTWAA